MYRKPDSINRPPSGKAYQTSPASFYPIQFSQTQPMFNSRIESRPKVSSIPFNQISSINFTSNQIDPRIKYETVIKPGSSIRLIPNTNKVFFTYINPQNHTVERHFIETIVRQTQKPITNEWEQRYFELFRQMNDLLINNEKISEEFLKMKEELKIYNDTAIMHSIQNFTKSQSPPIDTVPQSQYDQLLKKYEKLKLKLSEAERQATVFKQQNIRMEIAIQKLQNQIISEKNLSYKNQIQKSEAILKNTKMQYEVKQLTNQKLRLEAEIYDLKMALANKNMEIQNLMMKRNQDKNKSPEKMTQQKFQERLTRIRGEYQKKEKKFQKMLEAKQKEISEIRKVMVEVQEKQRTAKELKQNYEKMYNEKKQEVANLKKLNESLLNSQEDERQILLYEQRINELNKMARQQAEKIKELQKSKNQMAKKIEQYQDNYVSQEQLNYLHEVIETNKNQILEEGGINYDPLNNKAITYFNGKIFEKKMIYELKKDNQKLLQILHRLNLREYIPTTLINYKTATINHDSGSNISMAMQVMISQIFAKLDRLTEGVKLNSMKSLTLISGENIESPTKSPKSPNKKSRRKNEEAPKQTTALKVYNELEVIKVYLLDLSSTCQHLVKKLEDEHDERSIQERQKKQLLMSEIKITGMAPKDEQMIEFYKEKNIELEARISQLFNLSNMLKQKLCEKHGDQNSKEDYWKSEVKTIKEELDQLKARYEKLMAKFQKSQDKRQEFQSKCALYVLELERLNHTIREKQQKITTLLKKANQSDEFLQEKLKAQREILISVHRAEQQNAKVQHYIKLLGTKQKEIGQLNYKIGELNKNKQQLQSQNSQKLTSLQSLKRSLQICQYDLSESKKSYQYQLRLTQTAQMQINDLRRDIQTERNHNSQLQKQIAELSKRLQLTLHQNSAELESERKKITGFLSQISQFKLKIEQQYRKYAKLDRQYMDIKKKYESQLVNSLVLKNTIQQLTKSSQTRNGAGIDPYILQKLRSLILEIEVLFKEMIFESTTRNKDISRNMTLKFNLVLDIFGQIGNFTTNLSGGNSDKQLRQILHQHRQKLEDLEARILQSRSINQYKLELLRSLFIEFQCLVKQMKTTDSREKNIIAAIQTHIGKGLENIATFDLF